MNNELSALRRAFNLAIDKGILVTAPKIKLAKVDNARELVFVFQRHGRPIGSTTLVHQWQAATKRAGCEGRLIHDLRRTAARDFRAAGVDEGTIMALCGWKTRAMFDRYNIVNDADLAAAVARRYGIVAAESKGFPSVRDVISSSPV